MMLCSHVNARGNAFRPHGFTNHQSVPPIACSFSRREPIGGILVVALHSKFQSQNFSNCADALHAGNHSGVLEAIFHLFD